MLELGEGEERGERDQLAWAMDDASFKRPAISLIQGLDPLIQPRKILEFKLLDPKFDGLVAFSVEHHRSGNWKVERM